MFEHLDDPQRTNPVGGELDTVLARAGELRSRRHLTAVGLCLALLGASLAVFAIRLAPPPSSSVTAYQFDLQKGPLPIGTPVPTTALLSVHFASASDGFALALHGSAVLLAASTDGGSTWQVRNNHPPPGLTAAPLSPGQFEFVGSDGYLWGSQDAGAAPLWVTHDGGLTWQRASIGPDVVDVSAIGPDVWALVRTCPSTTPASASAPPTCTLLVEESPDRGGTWHASPTLASGNGSGGGAATPPPELARITDARAYVLTASSAGEDPPTWLLLFTDDDAATWSARPVPCTGAYALGAEVAASSTEDLWLLCGGQGTAGSQSKQLYRSSDGGLTWQLKDSASGLGLAQSSKVPPDSLPVAGYVAPFTIGHRNLAVLTPTTAWLFPSRANPLKSSDGGSTWVPVPSLASAGFNSGGAGNVTFLSATIGWICEYGIGLWHTENGVTWSPLGFS